MEIRITIRQLDEDEFRKECEKIEREQRKKNARDAFFVFLFIIVMIVILAGAGVPAEAIKLPWAW